MLLIENIFVRAANGILTERSDLWKISINRKYERPGSELVPKLANC